MEVKFLDLAASYKRIESRALEAFRAICESAGFVGGEWVARFEAEFSEFVGLGGCVGVGNGTDALEIALKALDLPPNSEVILPANTFFASLEAVLNVGLRARLVDCGEDYLLDVGALRAALGADSHNVGAIMPVHLYGQLCDMEAIFAVAREFGVGCVIEDSSQAHTSLRHSALSAKSAIEPIDYGDRPCVLSPQLSVQNALFSSQILECQGESSSKDSKGISESTLSDSHSVIASRAKQATKTDSKGVDCHEAIASHNDDKAESKGVNYHADKSAHKPLESQVDSESMEWHDFAPAQSRNAPESLIQPKTLACFSFYPGKNLGAFGDAGAIASDDLALLDKARALANHGVRGDKYRHELVGRNSRLDSLQAAILSLKLEGLEGANARRSEIAAMYDSALRGVEGYITPPRTSHTHSYHIYALRLDGRLKHRRDELREYLAARGIESGVHYPLSLPELPALRGEARVRVESGARAKAYAHMLISLPMGEHLNDAQVSYVCKVLLDFV